MPTGGHNINPATAPMLYVSCNIMTTLKLIIPFCLFGLCSCHQNKHTQTTLSHHPDPKAIKLNNETIKLAQYIHNSDSCRKALKLLDSATKIDDQYFLGHFNKLMFLSQLQEYDKAIATINKLITLKPLAHDLHLMAGIFYLKQKDTISATKHLNLSLNICNQVLDTMSSTNNNYLLFSLDKAECLFMLEREDDANNYLNALTAKQTDSTLKQAILSYKKTENYIRRAR